MQVRLGELHGVPGEDAPRLRVRDVCSLQGPSDLSQALSPFSLVRMPKTSPALLLSGGDAGRSEATECEPCTLERRAPSPLVARRQPLLASKGVAYSPSLSFFAFTSFCFIFGQHNRPLPIYSLYLFTTDIEPVIVQTSHTHVLMSACTAAFDRYLLKRCNLAVLRFENRAFFFLS